MSDPLISVAMGVKYNNENTTLLERSVLSLLEQTCRDFELLICRRDCSQNAEKFLEELAAQDKRLLLLNGSGTNHLGGQLNLCIKRSHGEFIARMDDDDFSYPERFSKQLKFLLEHPEIAFVGSNVRLVRDGKIFGKCSLPAFPQVKDFLFAQPFIHPSIIFRRECLMTVGGYSDAENQRGCEDYDLLLRLYRKGFCGANTEEILLDYSLPPKGKSRKTFVLRINETKTRMKLFSQLGLMPMALPYVIKPVAVGLIPPVILEWVKQYRLKKC